MYHFIQNLSGYIALHHRFDLKHVKQYASLGLEIERVYLYRKFTTYYIHLLVFYTVSNATWTIVSFKMNKLHNLEHVIAD